MFLWSSLDPDVLVEHEADLLAHYASESGLGTWDHQPSLWLDYRVAFLDYVRYLTTDMWKAVTPTTAARDVHLRNLSVHRRDVRHLLRMAARAADLLVGLERGEWSLSDPGDIAARREKKGDGEGEGEGEGMAEPRTSTSGTRSIPAPPATGPNHTVGMGIRGGSLESRFMTQEWRLLRGGDLWDVVQVATCLAEGAGTIIRGYFARLHVDAGDVGVLDKQTTKNEKTPGGTDTVRGSGNGNGNGNGSRAGETSSSTPVDPQTQADVDAEAHIVGHLRRAFPALNIVGEEMFEAGADSGATPQVRSRD